MKESRIRPILLALLVAALLIIPLIAAAAPATKEFRKEIAARPGQTVNLDTGSGDILIDVPGTKLKAARKLELSTGDGAAKVKVRTSSGSIRIAGS